MTNLFKEFYDWSEVWATLIPIIVYSVKKPKESYLKPVITFLWIVLVLYALADTIWKVKHFFNGIEVRLPAFYWDNNFLYNTISLCRLGFFLWFFEKIKFRPFPINNVYVGVIAYTAIGISFLFEPFMHFSIIAFSCESIVLLTYAISYFLFLIKNDELRTQFEPSLFIITGIAIYEAANFFIFLFHKALLQESSEFTAAIWKLSNVYYIVLCLYFTKAFYGRKHVLISSR